MTNLPSACIIGAGSSGITAAKALQERGVPFDLLEMSDRVGGNWAIDNPNGVSSAYRSLHIDTSSGSRELARSDRWPARTDFLPDLDGFEVASELTARGLSVVVLTSSRDGRDFGPLIEQSGARGFIPKAELSGESLATALAS